MMLHLYTNVILQIEDRLIFFFIVQFFSFVFSSIESVYLVEYSYPEILYSVETVLTYLT